VAFFAVAFRAVVFFGVVAFLAAGFLRAAAFFRTAAFLAAVFFRPAGLRTATVFFRAAVFLRVALLVRAAALLLLAGIAITFPIVATTAFIPSGRGEVPRKGGKGSGLPSSGATSSRCSAHPTSDCCFRDEAAAAVVSTGLDLETPHEPASRPVADLITSECNVARILRIVTFD
jgi:hypothetical protein